jgi:DNA-binding transcriptional LysR family regulator
MGSERLLHAMRDKLPAFRAIAETEHLPTAARRLNTSVAKLVQSIEDLERAVGHALFTRTGESLVLNLDGRRLLGMIQEAHRALDKGVSPASLQPMQGALRVSTITILTDDFVLPPILELRARHPGVQPILIHEGPRNANALLARAQIDVAFYYDAIPHEDLEIMCIGEVTASVYCSMGHPLFDEDPEAITIDTVLAHPFCVPLDGDRGLPRDRWPVDLPRKIGMQISALTSGLKICLDGRLLAVLLDAVAYPFVIEGRLRRIPFEPIAPIELHAARSIENRSQLVDELVDGVKNRTASLSSMLDDYLTRPRLRFPRAP